MLLAEAKDHSACSKHTVKNVSPIIRGLSVNSIINLQIVFFLVITGGNAQICRYDINKVATVNNYKVIVK